MKKKTIKKSIGLTAPKEKVWDVLVNDHYNRVWYAMFSEGTKAETDWKMGSKAVFTDHSGSGIVGRILQVKTHEILSIVYEGIMDKNGREDYESENAKEVKGWKETYTLSEKEGTTHLSISCDMAENYFESMSQAWDNALLKIKELSETR